jgi:hypothetical protein
VNVVANDQEVGLAGVGSVVFNSIGEDVLGVLNQCLVIIQVVRRVQIKVGGMVSHVREALATGTATFRVRRAEILRDNTKDISECHFVVVDLVIELIYSQSTEILV